MRYVTVRCKPSSASTRLRRSGITLTVVAAFLAAATVGPTASGADDDELRDRQHQLDERIQGQEDHVDGVSARLLRAQDRVDTASLELSDARAYVEDLERQVQQAERLDARLEVALAQAVVRLRNARADLVQGADDVAAQRSALVGYAIADYQSKEQGLAAFGFGLDAQSARQAVDSIQDSDSVFNMQTAALQRLQAGEVLLSLTEERVESSRDDLAVERQAAADNLATKRRLERAATAATRQVAERVAELRSRRQDIAVAKQQELDRLRELENERADVEDRLRAIAERRAAAHDTTIAARPPASVTTTATLAYPVGNTYVTSLYGMRMHPILHVYKLHDGLDLHADCGTPVYAAAAGTVTDEYFNTGYGNRLLIDHGYVEGVSLATSYNHLTSFVASPGQHVEQGQLIAYSGTTGYSTGCHMHFMVYVNGATVDPLTWL